MSTALDALLKPIACSECGFADGLYPNARPGDHLRDLARIAAEAVASEVHDPEDWPTRAGVEMHFAKLIYQALAKAVESMR